MWLPQFSVWSRFGGDRVTPFSFWSPSAGGFILLSSTSRAKTWAGNSCGMAQISSHPNVKLKLWRQQGPFTLSIHGFSRSKHRHSNSLEPSRGEESTCGLHSMDSEVWVLAPNIYFFGEHLTYDSCLCIQVFMACEENLPCLNWPYRQFCVCTSRLKMSPCTCPGICRQPTTSLYSDLFQHGTPNKITAYPDLTCIWDFSALSNVWKDSDVTETCVRLSRQHRMNHSICKHFKPLTK